MKKCETTPIISEPGPHIRKPVNLVYGFVCDDLLKDIGWRIPVDALHNQKAAVEPCDQQVAEIRIERAQFGVGPGTPVTMLIGPEGGFSEREAKEARRVGAAAVSLGDNRLRTETAAIVAVALAIAVLGGQED